MRRATSGVFNIQTISFLDPAGPQAFVRSLHETGFAVIRDHPITAARIDATYKKWGSWFKGTNKQPFLFDPNKQDGWFPMLSENAKVTVLSFSPPCHYATLLTLFLGLQC